MLKNYIKIAVRDFWRNKTFSLINIVGLTIGTASCLLILLYVKDQYGYDTYHPGAEHLYRVTTKVTEQNNDFLAATCSPPIIPAMKQDFPEIEAATRILNPPGNEPRLLAYKEKKLYETKGYYADSTFFDVFKFKWIEGQSQHALTEPYSIVLSSALAKRLFGNGTALGQAVRLDNDSLFRVTGVFDEGFGRSHMNPNFLMSMNSGGLGSFVMHSNQWLGQNFVHGYIRLRPDADPKAVEKKLGPFLLRHGRDQLAGISAVKTLSLQPVEDIHLHSKMNYELEPNMDADLVRIILLIALLIQLMACINFMNLSTARSTKRAREVGVCKTIGASKASLIFRFLSESLLLALISVILAIPLVNLAIPFFKDYLQLDISPASLDTAGTWAIVSGLVVVTGLLAGLYPAFYLSAYKVVAVLKGDLKNSFSAAALRRVLIVTQFVISVVLVIAVLVIFNQVAFMRSKYLGFDQKEKVLIPFRSKEAQRRFAVIKADLLSRSEVLSAGGVQYFPGQALSDDIPINYNHNSKTFSTAVELNRVDPDYLNVLKIQLLAGRNLTSADSNNRVIVNETALHKLGIPLDNAIGQVLSFDYQNMHDHYTIVGVVHDYNTKALREEIKPVMLLLAKRTDLQYLVAEIRTNHYSRFFAALGSSWNKLVPEAPFEYSFLDQDIQKLYQSENSLLLTISLFSIFAIIIACLGLVGLAAFVTEQRIKEIGIRKVLGASVIGIVSLIAKGFSKLIVIAVIIASPIAYYAMHKWLQEYPYRVDVDWWVFAVAGLGALLLGLITISLQVIKAAVVNPVNSLRSE